MLVEIPTTAFCYLITIENDIIKGLTYMPLVRTFSRYISNSGRGSDTGPHCLNRKIQLVSPMIGTFIDKTVTICDQPNEWEPNKENFERTLHLFFTNFGIFAVAKNEVKVLME
jgi:hypothetical protein